MRAESGRTSKAVRPEFEECGDIPELPTTCPQGRVRTARSTQLKGTPLPPMNASVPPNFRRPPPASTVTVIVRRWRSTETAVVKHVARVIAGHRKVVGLARSRDRQLECRWRTFPHRFNEPSTQASRSGHFRPTGRAWRRRGACVHQLRASTKMPHCTHHERCRSSHAVTTTSLSAVREIGSRNTTPATDRSRLRVFLNRQALHPQTGGDLTNCALANETSRM